MNEVLRERLDQCVTVYLDDILVFSKTPEEHEAQLRWVFGKLREHQLYAKRSKCTFGTDHIEYLGHVVSAKGIAPDPEKVKVIKTWPEPTS